MRKKIQNCKTRISKKAETVIEDFKNYNKKTQKKTLNLFWEEHCGGVNEVIMF